MVGRLEELLVSVRRQVLDNYLSIERTNRMLTYLEDGQDRVNASVAARLAALEARPGVPE